MVGQERRQLIDLAPKSRLREQLVSSRMSKSPQRIRLRLGHRCDTRHDQGFRDVQFDLPCRQLSTATEVGVRESSRCGLSLTVRWCAVPTSTSRFRFLRSGFKVETMTRMSRL